MALGTLVVEAARRVLSARTARLTRETARARVVGTNERRNLKERWTHDTFPRPPDDSARRCARWRRALAASPSPV